MRGFTLLFVFGALLGAQNVFPPASSGGTVSSVAITSPSSLFSESGCTITTSGTCALSFATGQTANRVFATNASGNVGSFALTTAMLPSIASTFLSDSATLIRSTDTGSVTSTMLAGSIANAKLSNSSLTIAGHSVSLGATQTLALSDLTGSITATQLPSTYNPDVPPTVAGAIDDEFNGASLTGWTQVNQGTSTTTVANGVISVIPQISNGAHRLYAITKTEPVAGGPWTVTAKINIQDTVVVNTYMGLCVYDGTKLSTIELTNLAGTLSIGWTHWTNVTSPTVTTVRTIGGNWSSGWVWLQINNDGTNLNFNVSSDGRLFNQIHTETKASFLANTGSVGIYGNVTATAGTWTLDADYIRSTP